MLVSLVYGCRYFDKLAFHWWKASEQKYCIGMIQRVIGSNHVIKSVQFWREIIFYQQSISGWNKEQQTNLQETRKQKSLFGIFQCIEWRVSCSLDYVGRSCAPSWRSHREHKNWSKQLVLSWTILGMFQLTNKLFNSNILEVGLPKWQVLYFYSHYIESGSYFAGLLKAHQTKLQLQCIDDADQLKKMEKYLIESHAIAPTILFAFWFHIVGCPITWILIFLPPLNSTKAVEL